MTFLMLEAFWHSPENMEIMMNIPGRKHEIRLSIMLKMPAGKA
jgi:hypothetical protein